MVNRDLNLLFGIMAVLLKRVSPDQLVEAAAWWATDPTSSLADRMVTMGVLDERDRAFLDEVVARAVASHGGDASSALSSFGGEEQVAETFQDSIPPVDSQEMRTIRQSIQRVPASDYDLESVPAVKEASGRYSQVSEYGRGGMGRVLLVQDAFLNRQVALKELLPDLKGRETPATPGGFHRGLLNRFLQEARITGQLEHPSIVPVYELGRRDDGALYYTMKLVRGTTLRNALQQSRSLRERLALLPHMIDLCHAIAFAHSQRVIHRDIKPANIMIGEFGETVVLDWGLAKALDNDDAHAEGLRETMGLLQAGDADAAAATAYGEVIGTPAYMSPEQARGDLDEIDERSDIYALGTILYEVLTGHPPFTGGTAVELLPRVLNEDPLPVERREPGAPPELAAIAMRALAKDPAERYASAKDMADDIGAFQSGALVAAHAYRPWDHLARFARQHKGVLVTAAAAVLVVAAVTIAGYFRVLGERDRARQAEGNLEVVAEFQSRMLAEVDPRAMGETLRHLLSAEFGATGQAEPLTTLDGGAGATAAEHHFERLDFTGAAVRMLDSQVLANARAAAERDYAEQPLVQARLFQTIARARANLGIHDGTLVLQQRAITMLALHLGDGAPATQEARANLGLILWMLGSQEAGVATLERALAALEHHWAADDPRLVGYRYVVAQLKREEPLSAQAGADDFQTLLGRASTLTVLFGTGKLDEWGIAATDLIALASPMMEADGHPPLDALMSLLPTLSAGQWADTTEAQRDDLVRMVEWVVSRLPETAPFTVGSTLPELAKEFDAFGDHEGALDLYRRAYLWFREHYGNIHPRTVSALDGLTTALITAKRWHEAETEALEIADRLSALHGSGSPEAQHAITRLVLLYETWHAHEPDAGQDAAANTWRTRIRTPESVASDTT